MASILAILHQEHSTAGRLGHVLQGRGFSLDVCKPRFGEELPATLARHAGVIVFGGPMSANDADAYIRREIDWLAVPLKEQKPMLGICLGAQMLVRHLGGRVAPHADGRAEIGYYPVRPTEHGRRISTQWPGHVYQWHREGFEQPPGSELTAEGDSFPVQAFRIGRAHGLQFHPEVTHAMMCRWTTLGHERLSLPGAKPRAQHFAERAVHDFLARAWLEDFLDHWIGEAKDHDQQS